MNYYFFIDTERDRFDRVIEIGIAVFNKQGGFIDQYKSYVRYSHNFKNSLTPILKKLTGITYETLSIAPNQHQVIKSLNVFLSNYITSDFKDIAMFCWGDDKQYIKHFYNSTDKNNYRVNIVDVQYLVMSNITEPRKSKEKLEYLPMRLNQLSAALNIPFDQSHSAVEDAIQLGYCYFKSKEVRSNKDYLYVSAYSPECLFFEKDKLLTQDDNIENLFKYIGLPDKTLKTYYLRRSRYKQIVKEYRKENIFYQSNQEDLLKIKSLLSSTFQEFLCIKKQGDYLTYQKSLDKLIDHDYYWNVFNYNFLNAEYYTGLKKSVEYVLENADIIFEGTKDKQGINGVKNNLNTIVAALQNILKKEEVSYID